MIILSSTETKQRETILFGLLDAIDNHERLFAERSY